LLTRVRFDQMLASHIEHRSMATMAVKEYDFQVPYGVVKMDGTDIASIDEKQVQRFFINAGIYVLSPESLDQIPKGEFLDMPTLFERFLAAGETTSGYLLREYWLDIGRLDEFERAQHEWAINGIGLRR
jgi:NDP-sugar pyrophosphorylase family protein